MLVLVLGLFVFIGLHSIRIFADGWRTKQIARHGKDAWMGAFSLIAVTGLGLITWGYSLTRATPVDLWWPPLWTRPIAAVLTWIAFMLLAAAYVPGSRIKAAIGHPMLAGTQLWAASHLLANGRLADVVLFGSFGLWSVALFVTSRRRDRREGVQRAIGPASRELIVLAGGTAYWAFFALWFHGWLLGISPLVW